jgi:hypothetical protein
MNCPECGCELEDNNCPNMFCQNAWNQFHKWREEINNEFKFKQKKEKLFGVLQG